MAEMKKLKTSPEEELASGKSSAGRPSEVARQTLESARRVLRSEEEETDRRRDRARLLREKNRSRMMK